MSTTMAKEEQDQVQQQQPLLMHQNVDEDDSCPLDEWAIVNEESEVVESIRSSSSSVEVLDTTTGSAETTNFGKLRIRLRIGEQIRDAFFCPTERVESFIQEFFPQEVASHKKVRLIYMGMLLLPDRFLGEYGIVEDGVIHSVITETAPLSPQQHQNEEIELKHGITDPTSTFLILSGIILYALWTFFYHFPQMFSWKSITLLSMLSMLHLRVTFYRMTGTTPTIFESSSSTMSVEATTGTNITTSITAH